MSTHNKQQNHNSDSLIPKKELLTGLWVHRGPKGTKMKVPEAVNRTGKGVQAKPSKSYICRRDIVNPPKVGNGIRDE